MDLDNEKIGPAYNAPDSYFKESESRLLQRLGIDINSPEAAAPTIEAIKPVEVLMKVDTSGIQKRARKQDPLTSKSVGVDKDVDSVGKVEIAPLTFTTNENPEWVNFSAISEETTGLGDSLNITKVTYGDLLNPVAESIQIESVESEIAKIETIEEVSTFAETEEFVAAEVAINVIKVETAIDETATGEVATGEVATGEVVIEEVVLETEVSEPQEEFVVESIIEEESKTPESIIIHEVPESVGLDELESYIAPINAQKAQMVEEIIVEEEPQTINLDAPPTAFAPIAGRQKESATPGWLGIAASLAAIVAAYFIWNAIQPPKAEEAMANELQQDEPTLIESPLDEPISPKDKIPDGLQLLEPLLAGEMPKYKEPNIYTIIDAKEMPPLTKQALQDLEDNGLATFDMEDEMFEELDFESL
ncbi:MAG: hypothetical protein O2814_07910 [Bacteroidetes bacterium]|nr:hypothetical protein [Bacteroidota bacterium]